MNEKHGYGKANKSPMRYAIQTIRLPKKTWEALSFCPRFTRYQ